MRHSPYLAALALGAGASLALAGTTGGTCASGSCAVTPEAAAWAQVATGVKADTIAYPRSTRGAVLQRIRLSTQQPEDGGDATVCDGRQEATARYRWRGKSVTFRNVTIADLLRREPAELDMDSIRDYVENRRVLATGAAGSIGSELCRQILRSGPSELVLLDNSEYALYNIERELREHLKTLIDLRQDHFFDSHFAGLSNQSGRSSLRYVPQIRLQFSERVRE